MNTAKFITLALLLVILLSPVTLAFAEEVYTLSHYEATFELTPNSAGHAELRDVAVTLVITYNITSGPKSSGYKFVGTLPIKDVSVTDGAGKPLKFTTDKLTEYRINWEFAPIHQGQQTVIVRFTILDALEGSLDKNSLRLEWVKNWKVPVSDVTYRFILPNGYAFNQIGMVPTGKMADYQDRKAIEAHLDKLTDQTLAIEFSPGVAEGRSQPAPSPSGGRTSRSNAWLILLIMSPLLGGVGVLIWASATGQIKSSGSGGGCSGGGGCGGGGCGGGCGGCGG